MFTNPLIKIIISILLIILIGPITPWWSFSIITLLIGCNMKTLKESIGTGFTIGFLSWFIVLVYSYYNGGHIIFTKISLLLNLNNIMFLIFLSSLLSGFIGLLTSYLGYQFRKK